MNQTALKQDVNYNLQGNHLRKYQKRKKKEKKQQIKIELKWYTRKCFIQKRQ